MLLSIVFNGEIYNFAELRRELQALGARFVTDHTDTEVLLHGWRQWGRDLPNRLNGMWAFAIYDRRTREVFLSRDRFGKKPLFYFAGPRNVRVRIRADCVARTCRSFRDALTNRAEKIFRLWLRSRAAAVY